MKTPSLLGCGLLIPVLWLGLPPEKEAGGAGPHALLEMHAALCKALDTGDGAAFEGLFAKNAQPAEFRLFLTTDLQPVVRKGAPPVAATMLSPAGRAACVQLLRDLAEKWKTGGKAVTTVTASHADCHSPELGYCTIEFTRTVEDGSTRVSRAFRSTALGRYEDGGFRLLHWHVSPAGDLNAEQTPAPAEKSGG